MTRIITLAFLAMTAPLAALANDPAAPAAIEHLQGSDVMAVDPIQTLKDDYALSDEECRGGIPGTAEMDAACAKRTESLEALKAQNVCPWREVTEQGIESGWGDCPVQ